MADIDGSVVEALKRGEEQAYAIVVDGLYRSVYRFALRLCRNSSSAEDIAQETFLAVWQAIDSFRGRSRFKTWVFGIAYHQFLRWRDQRCPATVRIDEGRDEVALPDSLAAVENMDERARVRRAVYDLSDPYREAVCLIHFEGLSYREAAEVVDVPVGTIKSRMNVAFKLLREKLGGNEVQDDEVRQSESLPGQPTQIL